MGVGQEAASIYAKIGADISGLQGGLDKAGGIIGGFAKTMGVSLVAAGAAIVGIGAGVLKLASDAAPLVGVQAAFEGISGAADKTIEALRKGSLGMVKDADLMKSYNTAAQLVSKTFADQLPDAMGYLSKVSAATGQDMGFMMESLVKGIGRMSPMILDNLGIQVNLVEANEAYAKSIGKNADELTKAEQQTALMNMTMAKLATNTAAMPEIAGSAAQGMASLGTTLANIKDKAGMALVPVLQAILTPLSQLASEYGPKVVTWATNFAGVLTATVVPGIQSLFGAFSEVTALLSGTGGDWSALEEQLGAVFGPDIAARVTGFISGLSGLGTAVAPAIAMFTGALSGIGPILGQIGGMIGGLVADVAPLFIQFVTQAAALVMTNLPLIQATISNALTAIQIIWTAVWPVLSGVLTTAWATIQVVIQTALSVINGVVTTAMQLLQGDWSGAWDTILSTVTTILDGVDSVLSTVIGGLAGVVMGFLPGMIQAGSDLLSGLATGIGNALGGVIAKAQEVASGIVNAVKNALGVHSPSTLMESVGEDFISGFIQGVDAKQAEAAAKLAGFANTIAQAVGSWSDVLSKTGGVAGLGGLTANIQGALDKLFPFLNQMAAKFKGAEGLGKAAEIGRSISGILGLLGANLEIGELKKGWSERLDAWLKASAIAGDKLVRGLANAAKVYGVDVLTKAGELSASMKNVLDLLSVSMDVKAPPKDFGARLDAWLKASAIAGAKLISGLQNAAKVYGIDALKEAGQVGESVKKVMELLGISMEVKLPPGNLAKTLNAYFANLDQGFNRALQWLLSVGKGWTAEALAAAGQTASGVNAIMDVFGVDFAGMKAPPTNIGSVMMTYVSAMNKAMDVAVPALTAMNDKWGDALGVAQETAGKVAGVFDAINSIAQSVADAADIGGIDVGSARALMLQMQQLLMPAPGVIAPDIGGIVPGGNAGGAPDLSGVLTTLQNWNPKVQININIAVQGGTSSGLSFDVGGMDSIAEDMYIQAAMAGAVV